MDILDIDTELLPPGERLDAWRAGIRQGFGPIELELMDGHAPTARLRSTRRERFSFHAMLYRGIGLWRRPQDLARLDGEYFTLTHPTAGRLHVTQDGRERELAAGGLYLFNHAVSYRTQPDAEYQTTSIAIPAELLRQRVPGLQPFHDLGAGCTRAGGAALIGSFAGQLAGQVQAWSPHEFERLSEQLLDLIGLFLEAPRALGASAETCTRAGHRQRAIDHIRANASDPALTPAEVARACGISLSYLHEVFRHADSSVEARIFEERLLTARRLLIDPRLRGLPVSTLAYDAGFNDPAHFSRSFKRRWGLTPGELRRQALAGALH